MMPHSFVTVAVVTSGRRVLLGRRRDGNPPWVFPGGKAELGETPEETAVRETAEETGLTVTVAGEIARRVHPVTGRLLVYVAAVPAEGSEARPGDELTEVRWTSPEEADGLTDGTIFEPVREYLRRVAGGLQGERQVPPLRIPPLRGAVD
jgi:8-oxo-dGTP diphosphatase